jgi:hypothetical protein
MFMCNAHSRMDMPKPDSEEDASFPAFKRYRYLRAEQGSTQRAERFERVKIGRLPSFYAGSERMNFYSRLASCASSAEG